jgi:hypothetical protein
MEDVATVAQAQLAAFNARNLAALVGTYAPDAQLLELGGAVLADGRDQIRERFQARFSEPNLHAQLLSRAIMGDIVVDTERVTRSFVEGPGTLEMLCLYEIVDGLIRRAWFAAGARTLG